MKYLPILHPAALMRDPTMWGVTVSDLVRAKEESRHAAYTPEPLDFTIIQSEAELREALQLMPPPEPVALDIETSGSRITCIGLCQQPPVVYVVPGEVALAGQSCFRSWAREAFFLIHNAPFDVPRLAAEGITLGGWDDTLLLHHSVYSELPQTLAFVQSVYTRLPYHKGMVKFEREEEK